MGSPTDGASSLLDILRGLRGLGRAGTVLHVGAHPDDEDAGLLAMVARKHATRVVYWSATRGEGGQNFVGRERGEELGLLRTWESLRARGVDGAEALFGPFIDFGYSKTPAQTLHRWGREAVVRELVRAIRAVQPLVVVSRWSGEERDEHGHHRAVGASVLEAFDAAGDPARFPEFGAQHLPPWRPARLYVSTDGDWQPGEGVRMGRHKPEFEVPGYARINTGEYDPWLRRSYQSLAWEAFANHRSQGVAIPPEWGSFYYYYRVVRAEDGAERTFHESLHAGLDATLGGVAGRLQHGIPGAAGRLSEVERAGAEAERCFLAQDTVGAARALVAARRALAALIEAAAAGAGDAPARAALGRACARKRGEVDALIAACLGLHLEGRVGAAHVTPGERFTVHSSLWNPLGAPIARARIDVAIPRDWTREVLESGGAEEACAGTTTAIEAHHAIRVPADATLSCPYWLVAPHDGFRYAWPQAPVCGSPFGPDPVHAVATFDFEGDSIELRAVPVHVENVDVGFRRLPVSVVPPVTLGTPRSRELLPVAARNRDLELVVVASTGANVEQVEATLVVSVPDGWTAQPQASELNLSPAARSQRVSVRIGVPEGLAAGRFEVRFGVRCRGRDYEQVVSTVRLGSAGRETGALTETLRDEHVLRPARLQVDIVDAAPVPGYRFAYVPGADEGVLEALQDLGFALQRLDEDTLRHGDLAAFDTIAVGANAFVLRAEMREAAARLLGYVEGGGTLLVQHQGYAYERMFAAPFPFRYRHPHDRVTAPDAPVRILEPGHPVMSFPNCITQSDFDGWVRDRGLYFFGEWDSRYRALLATHDPEEAPREGALLLAAHGRGNYVYSGLSFFRQIPAGVHGAIRLFANLLALPAALARERKQLLRETYLFAGLPDEELDAVARIVYEASFPDGAIIGHEGDAGDELYLIVSGEVDILRSDGGTRPIYRASPGELVGELAVLSHISRTATMRARGKVSLLRVKGEHFHPLLERHPQVAQAVIRILADKLVHGSGG